MHAKQMMIDGFVDNERINEMRSYAEAAVRLYGVISMNDYIGLINYYNGEVIDIEEARSLLVDARYKDQGYTYFRGYLVNNEIMESDTGNIGYYLKISKNVPRYRPGKHSFLNYASAGYLENTPQLRRMMQYVNAYGTMPEADDDVMEDICYLNRLRADCEEYIDMLRIHGVVVDIWDIPDISAMITDMQMNTRLWVFGGHTLKEIEAF